MNHPPRYRYFKKAAIAVTFIIFPSICGIAAGNAANPVATTRFVLLACWMWNEIWPFPRGGDAPLRLINVFYNAGIFKPVQMKVEPGFFMELDSRDLVTRCVLIHGIWEPHITGITMALLQEGSVFVDVGAHVGYYSLLAATQVGPSGKVIAIEPNPPTSQRLRRNIRLNNFTNIMAEQVACTDKEQPLEFFQASDTGGSSLSAQNAHSASKVTVRGIPLDLIIKRHNLQRIDLVKIDVQGAELQVLRGMKETMGKYRPKIITELQPELLVNMGASRDEVAAFLRQAGYVRARQIGDADYLWTPDVAPLTPQ